MSARRPEAAASGKESGPARPSMVPEPDDAEQSVRRIRRGCMFIGLTFVALAVLFVSATGNLFYLSLILVGVAVAALSRLIK